MHTNSTLRDFCHRSFVYQIACRRVDPTLTASLPAKVGFLFRNFPFTERAFRHTQNSTSRDSRVALYIAIKTGLSAAFPIVAPIIINPGPSAQEAKKLVP